MTLRTEKDGADKFKYSVIPVNFSTLEENIEISKTLDIKVFHPKAVIELEMSKRELMRYYAEN